MADEIDLTNGMMRAAANGTIQPLAEALDVSAYDILDLVLWVGALEGTFTGSGLVITIITGMSKETEDGWVPLQSFTGVTASNIPQKLGFTGLLRYVRWKVTGFTGGTAAAFSITGMARNN